MPSVTLPTVHMNGTSKQALLDGYVDAMRAVEEARIKIRQIEFNPRDYYVQGEGAWSKAVAEREDLQSRLKAVYDELETIAIHVSDSGK